MSSFTTICFLKHGNFWDNIFVWSHGKFTFFFFPFHDENFINFCNVQMVNLLFCIKHGSFLNLFVLISWQIYYLHHSNSPDLILFTPCQFLFYVFVYEFYFVQERQIQIVHHGNFRHFVTATWHFHRILFTTIMAKFYIFFTTYTVTFTKKVTTHMSMYTSFCNVFTWQQFRMRDNMTTFKYATYTCQFLKKFFTTSSQFLLVYLLLNATATQCLAWW